MKKVRKLHLKKYISEARRELGLKRVYPSKRYEIYDKASELAAKAGLAPETIELWERAELAKKQKKQKKSAYQRLIEFQRDMSKLTDNARRVRLHRIKKAREG